MDFTNSLFHSVVQLFARFSCACPLFCNFHFTLPPVGACNRSSNMYTCSKMLLHQGLHNPLCPFFAINGSRHLNEVTHVCLHNCCIIALKNVSVKKDSR